MNAELLVLEQLGERDVRFIVNALVQEPADRERVARLAHNEPSALEAMLGDVRLAQRIMADQDIILRISPYLLFAVLLRQVRRDLERAGYTPEWAAPRSRVPVFDTKTLAGLLANHQVLHYLADMLASFTQIKLMEEPVEDLDEPCNFVHSWGTDELDVASLIRLGAESPHAQRLAVFRRVGDVALLLTGIFPDYIGREQWRGLPDRFTSALGAAGGKVQGEGAARRHRDLGPAEQIEEIGRRYYRMAARHPNAGWLGWDRLLNLLAEEFTRIRKILNVLSDLYIHRLRFSWFPGPEL